MEEESHLNKVCETKYTYDQIEWMKKNNLYKNITDDNNHMLINIYNLNNILPDSDLKNIDCKILIDISHKYFDTLEESAKFILWSYENKYINLLINNPDILYTCYRLHNS